MGFEDQKGDKYRCIDCSHEWKTRNEEGNAPYCPRCSSRNIENFNKKERIDRAREKNRKRTRKGFEKQKKRKERKNRWENRRKNWRKEGKDNIIHGAVLSLIELKELLIGYKE